MFILSCCVLTVFVCLLVSFTAPLSVVFLPCAVKVPTLLLSRCKAHQSGITVAFSHGKTLLGGQIVKYERLLQHL